MWRERMDNTLELVFIDYEKLLPEELELLKDVVAKVEEIDF